jgi:hypothetical protein
MCVAALIRAFSRSIFLITSAIFLSSSAMVTILGGDLVRAVEENLDSDSRGCKMFGSLQREEGLLFERPTVGSPD